MTYAAVLGNHPKISLAELRAAIPDFAVKRMIGQGIAIFSSEKELDNDDLQNWGGIFMLAREVPGHHALPDVPRLLDRLEKAKLISRERNQDDRRHVTARITEKGRELVEKNLRDIENRKRALAGAPAAEQDRGLAFTAGETKASASITFHQDAELKS